MPGVDVGFNDVMFANDTIPFTLNVELHSGLKSNEALWYEVGVVSTNKKFKHRLHHFLHRKREFFEYKTETRRYKIVNLKAVEDELRFLIEKIDEELHVWFICPKGLNLSANSDAWIIEAMNNGLITVSVLNRVNGKRVSILLPEQEQLLGIIGVQLGVFKFNEGFVPVVTPDLSKGKLLRGRTEKSGRKDVS